MVRDKLTVSTRTLQWKCVESRADSKRLYYGRFILAPLMKGQANTVGTAMRRPLLGEIEGTCICLGPILQYRPEPSRPLNERVLGRWISYFSRYYY